MAQTHADFVVETVVRDDTRRSALDCVFQLNLRDGWIGAGFVRSAVWDRLSGRPNRTPLPDIDVIYFDPDDTSKDVERSLERALSDMLPGFPWSVKNQARMHVRNDDPPYVSTDDAMRHWAETATCVAIRTTGMGSYELLAPFGLEDLMAMCIRPTPHFVRKPDVFRARTGRKDWRAIWPEVTVREY